MKRVVLMLALALIPAAAMAGSFTYHTTGQFDCGVVVGCVAANGVASSSATIATTALNYTAQPSLTLNAPTGATFGQFTYNPADPAKDFTGVGFTMTLFHEDPGVGNHDFIGSVSGILGGSSSSLYWIVSDPTSFAFAGPGGIVTTYFLNFTDPNSPGAGACAGKANCIQLGSNNATINGFVTQVPEPASIMLLGTGLSGLAGVIRRRMKK